jgi:hypothetical protein
MTMTMMGPKCLIPEPMARVVGLFHTLQDDLHHPEDFIGRAPIPGDPGDRGHTNILKDLGHVPHQGLQPAGLDDMVYLGVPKKPSNLNELHQLIAIILSIEPPGLYLHKCCYA